MEIEANPTRTASATLSKNEFSLYSLFGLYSLLVAVTFSVALQIVVSRKRKSEKASRELGDVFLIFASASLLESVPVVMAMVYAIYSRMLPFLNAPLLVTALLALANFMMILKGHWLVAQPENDAKTVRYYSTFSILRLFIVLGLAAVKMAVSPTLSQIILAVVTYSPLCLAYCVLVSPIINVTSKYFLFALIWRRCRARKHAKAPVETVQAGSSR